jgi:hypothetical protein
MPLRLGKLRCRQPELFPKRIMGYQQLWTLDAKLKALAEEETIDTESRVA